MKIKVMSGVSAIGLPVLAPTFTKILNTIPSIEAEFVSPEKIHAVNWNEVDAVWNLGFFFDIDCFFDWLKALYPEVKTVNTWVGSDILNSAAWFKQRTKCYHCALRSIDLHVADGLNLAEELKQNLGLESHYVPSVPDPLPLSPIMHKSSYVAAYAPAHRKDFYHHPQIVEVARLNPHMHFDFYSYTPDPDFPTLPNCHFRGFLQGEAKLQAFKDDAYLITLPEHGSVSIMLIEFMMMGRRVITNIDAPFVYKVQEPVTVEGVQKALEKANADGSKGPNEEASKYYHKEYGFEKVRGYIEPMLKELEK